MKTPSLIIAGSTTSHQTNQKPGPKADFLTRQNNLSSKSTINRNFNSIKLSKSSTLYLFVYIGNLSRFKRIWQICTFKITS
jgi:hypothetical protein